MFSRKSLRDHELDNREAAGLPVIECPSCGERVDHRSGHWVPEHIDQYGLVVQGYYTCKSGDAA